MTNLIFFESKLESTSIKLSYLSNHNLNKELLFKGRNLSFRYNTEYLFKNLNFSIIKGKKYLIKGKSGTGKSTFFKLLVGYLNNYQGDLEIMGIDIKNLSSKEIAEYVSYIQQENYLFKGTVKSNLTLNNQYTEETLADMLTKVGFINPHELLSKEVGQGGKNLSRGQRQRIALARALLTDKKILLLDESFSSLDQQSAIKLETMLLLKKDYTIITISHTNTDSVKDLYDVIISFP